MSKIPTAEELRQNHQTTPRAQLIKIATHYGFTHRNGGSHLRFTHEDYPDITSGIPNDGGTHLSNHILADVIEAVQKRENALKLKTKQQFQLAADEAAATRLNDIKNKLPDHVEAFYDDENQIILRDTDVPQIGLPLYCEEEDAQLDVKIEQLNTLKHEFYADIGRAHTQYDIQVDRQVDGTYTLSHQIYDHMSSVPLPAYPQAEEPLTAIMTYIQDVESIDADHYLRRLAIEEKAEHVQITASTPRGERHNILHFSGDCTVPFKTATNQKYAGDGSRARISEGELKLLEQTTKGIIETNHMQLARA